VKPTAVSHSGTIKLSDRRGLRASRSTDKLVASTKFDDLANALEALLLGFLTEE